MHRFIWNENDQSSRQSVKGTKKLPNKFRKNETIFSSSLANKSQYFLLLGRWFVILNTSPHQGNICYGFE